MLTYFQGTGEFRSDFDPQVMAMAVRAAIDTVGTRERRALPGPAHRAGRRDPARCRRVRHRTGDPGGRSRVLRHPSYTGLLLAMTGVGLASANWASLISMTVLALAGILWRIHAEERALLATLGDPYRAYAAQHKRLVPLVW
jgi:hypothetical protein